MKLISMTDFVLEQEKYLDITNKKKLELIINYANFLKQPLELWMFVPCDEDGDVLEEPLYNDADLSCDELDSINNLVSEYHQAKERCLFDGFNEETASIYLGVFTNIKALSNL